MAWPWISRAAYDSLGREIEHLRIQNAQIIDALVRINRAEAGLPEKPTEKKPVEPMPDDIAEYVSQFGSGTVQQELENDAWAVYRRSGNDWDAVRKAFERHERAAEG